MKTTIQTLIHSQILLFLIHNLGGLFWFLALGASAKQMSFFCCTLFRICFGDLPTSDITLLVLNFDFVIPPRTTLIVLFKFKLYRFTTHSCCAYLHSFHLFNFNTNASDSKFAWFGARFQHSKLWQRIWDKNSRKGYKTLCTHFLVSDLSHKKIKVHSRI